jgi:hypothetical protein
MDVSEEGGGDAGEEAQEDEERGRRGELEEG